MPNEPHHPIDEEPADLAAEEAFLPPPVRDNAERLQRALYAKWPTPRTCPICHVVDMWRFGDFLQWTAPNFGADVYYEFSPVACGNCGYTFFVNTSLVGVGSAETLDDPGEDGDPS